jgi:hypothetical protein
VIRSEHSVRAVSVVVFLPLLFLPSVVAGQTLQEGVVPLKNWAAPLYWQPNQSERETSANSGLGIRPMVTQLSTSALTLVAITPCRLVDTRGVPAGFNGLTPFSGPSLAASSTTTFPVQSAAEATADTTPTPCGTIPSIAQAYSFNITVIPKTAGGIAFVTVWPSGGAQPAVSTINDGQGVILANAAIVPAGTPSGGVNVINSGPATMDLIIDMNGYYAEPTDLEVAGNIDFTGVVEYSGTAVLQLPGGVSSANIALGPQALVNNTSGTTNTAIGDGALFSNASGSNNTAVGYNALADYPAANLNTAVGYFALQGGLTPSANTGTDNTASGAMALQHNTTGSNNAATGNLALSQNTIGSGNTAVGSGALANNVVGNYNIAIGWGAGTNIGTDIPACTVGGNCYSNIDIGSPGVAGDTETIRIGSGGSGGTYINGIFNSEGVSGAAVLVTSSGLLATAVSSRRYKEDIQDMGDASRGLMDLRPVTFHYKKPAEDGSKPLQYGLIAEEVAEVYPDLVVYSKDGQPHTVQYQMLPSMLLNEVQRQQAEIGAQKEQLRRLEQQNASQLERLDKLEAALGATSRASGVAAVR